METSASISQKKILVSLISWEINPSRLNIEFAYSDENTETMEEYDNDKKNRIKLQQTIIYNTPSSSKYIIINNK